MNEISKLIEAYNRLWKNIEIMSQDIKTIFEDEFGMEHFIWGEYKENKVYDILFKDKMVFYMILDISCEIPFLQIIKLDLVTKKNITPDFLKVNEYKGWDPINEEDTEKKTLNENFISLTHKEYTGIASPQIDITSIDSTDTVNTEIKNLISCLINNNIKKFHVKKLKLL